MSAQHTPGPRYDVMAGINCPIRVMQWATAEEVDAFLDRTGFAVHSDRQIGRVLREITITRPSITKATGSAT